MQPGLVVDDGPRVLVTSRKNKLEKMRLSVGTVRTVVHEGVRLLTLLGPTHKKSDHELHFMVLSIPVWEHHLTNGRNMDLPALLFVAVDKSPLHSLTSPIQALP